MPLFSRYCHRVAISPPFRHVTLARYAAFRCHYAAIADAFAFQHWSARRHATPLIFFMLFRCRFTLMHTDAYAAALRY